MHHLFLFNGLRASICSAVVLAFVATLFGQGREEVLEERLEIPYRTAGDAYAVQQGKLDLYLPKNKKNFPVLVYFHGGGLTSGDKASDTSKGIALAMARKGIATVSVNYRLSPTAKYPAYVEDAAAGAAWVKKHIAEYGGNAQAVFIAGHSAGGYLAAMVGTAPQFLGIHGLAPTDFVGVIPMSSQITTHGTVRRDRGIAGTERFVDDSAVLHYANKRLPPILIIFGGNDNPGLDDVNREYVKTLLDKGHTDVGLFVAAGRTHNLVPNLITEPNDEVGLAMVHFIKSHLPKGLQVAKIGTVPNLHVMGNIFLAGQPKSEDLTLLKDRNIQTVICLRGDQEVDWDEAAQVEKAGMKFMRVPFQNREQLTDEVFANVLGTLRGANNSPVMLHCGSANRVGALWYAYRVLDGKLTHEEALAEAKEVGLRNAELEQRAKSYVEAQKGKKD